ncbi:hypothetical protein [Streptomyces sp. NPDC057939]|uniref:hypothetical protein n=1 Tax=Streptomyces sp. NPDC057939 TaxID=3346284 RepID=UPI0036E60902
MNSVFRRDHRLPGLVDAERAAAALQDLAERGWPTSYLAVELNTSTHTLAAIRSEQRRRLAVVLDQKIQRLAVVLLASDPADHGISEHRSRRSRTAARQRMQRPQPPNGSTRN